MSSDAERSAALSEPGSHDTVNLAVGDQAQPPASESGEAMQTACDAAIAETLVVSPVADAPVPGRDAQPASSQARAPGDACDTRDERSVAARSRPEVQTAKGERIGQYEFIRSLGHGGMGEVFLARDLRLGRLVAIKRLHTPGPALAARFLREARTTARCTHENIVVIHEVGEVGGAGGEPYMVLEYLEGQTLRAWLRARETGAGQREPVSPTRAVELMLPVVRALAYAHQRGIVHRDLKPENVMLTRAGGVKVLDFGIAKRVPIAATSTTEQPTGDSFVSGVVDISSGLVIGPANYLSSGIVGTLPYMSPEQMNAGEIDHRSDIWAVGIMLFELVAGRHPVHPVTHTALLRVADEHARVPSVLEVVPGRAAELGALAGIIDRCLLKLPSHRTPHARALLAELEALVPERHSARVGDDGNPFAGLAAFQEHDADRFFGRERDIDQVVGELRSRPLVALVGPSGAGKSSLVRAGVIPALKRSGEGWSAYVVRPGREPLTALAAMLQTTIEDDHGAGQASAGPDELLMDSASNAVLGPLVERIRAEPGYLGARLRMRAGSKLRRLVIFVDQLEELYTLGAPAAERTAFLASLAAAADDATSPLRVLVSMRSDFLDRLTEDRRLGREVTRGLLLLPPMAREGMRRALLGPLEAADYRFESPALLERMIDSLAQTPGALPLLQFTAARLWELRDSDRRMLTEASYERIGGVAGALATHADAVLGGLSYVRQAVARAVFERLVTPERTRALVSIAELQTCGGDVDTVDEIVQHLAAMRLLVIERGQQADASAVELAHESLIDRWPTLASWLDENEEDTALLARLRGAARDWERSGGASGLLWSGAVALEAWAWQQRYSGPLAPAERRFLAAVYAGAMRTRRTRRYLAAALVCISALLAVAMGWLAWNQTVARRETAALARQAAEEAARARDATRMSALRTIPEDPTTQLALLREIEDAASPPPGTLQEATRLLHSNVAPVVFTEHEDAVWSASFSPDGARVASASYDRTILLWSADGVGAPTVLRGHEDAVLSVNFSPDGTRLASASKDGSVRVWNTDGAGASRIAGKHEAGTNSASFSPDGSRVVSAAQDATVRVWNADGSGEPVVLRNHGDWDTQARFSPDGRRLVTAADDGTVRVWDELTPVAADDPRLWLLTTYCMPVARRVELLGVDETSAREHRARCLERVKRARRGRAL
ncbi:protein kinase domain-containing protein [Haliangium ochraceum]|uniref:Serine/threonine protein kinase with WD40 repeats n=1 Tax=Haliangium ochraceum (strain DSM 14365 / JCM 11303 / SMP-2) TaxID=502025 RepID=D0LTD7_HALO1|nr:protein kinase [Haliangium ochraceum]ACY13832.1 serine/threonine protein kinase with WD40 repeats [Haliangium ochraceum DSM 14365]